VVVNSRYEALPGHTVTAKVYNLDLTEKFSRSQVVDVAADSATRIFTIPAIDGLSRTYFVRLSLDDAAGHRVSSNFYWLSTQADVMDWPNLNYRYVPITTYMDLSGLDQLPPAVVTASWVTEQQGEEQLQRVTVRNVSGALAFLVRLTLLRGKDGADVAPAYWSDNYFELMPGEERQLTVTYPSAQLGGAPAYVRVGGWNVAEQ
jgi:exo-1,4-beta-D-glucosaminidase